MDNQIRRSRAVAGEWFYGNEVSDYGKQNGYVYYRTLAKAFDAVMNNNIMGDLENAGFYFEPVQDGSSDYTDEIDELRDAADERKQATPTRLKSSAPRPQSWKQKQRRKKRKPTNSKQNKSRRNASSFSSLTTQAPRSSRNGPTTRFSIAKRSICTSGALRTGEQAGIMC